MSTNDLVAYCGIYCGCCGRWCENAVIAHFATELAQLVDSHGYQYWMPEAVKEFDYKEFRKALDFLSDKTSWLICRKGCKQGNGRPDCEVRDCCREHGLSLCFECKQFPCSKVKGNERMIENAKEFARMGKERWFQQQIKKVRAGYELHTKKYYALKLSTPENERLRPKAHRQKR